jgi:FkbM family methyltransferase
MNKKRLLKNLEKVVSMKLQYRVPRFFKNYRKRLKVSKLKQNKESKDVPVIGKSFFEANLNLILPETVSSLIYTCGCYEEKLTRAFIELINPGDVFIDIGAHIGYFSRLASEVVGLNGKVYSFEPTASTYKLLESNTLSVKNIKSINKAVFSENKEIEFNDYGPRYSAMNSFTAGRFDKEAERGFTKLKVKAIKLDDFTFKNNIKPNFIKIDAESAEYDILQGMQKIMKTDKPIITVEVGDFGIRNIKTSKELIEYVMSFGYKPYLFDRKLIEHELREKYSYQNIILIPR